MDVTKLKGVIPDSVISQLPLVVDKFGANTPLRLSHFLAQLAHESGGFTKPVTIENLSYSARRMAEVWPKRYAVNPTEKQKPKIPNDLAKRLERNPVALGNNAYANRNGNGDEASGDGFKYRGRGYIQLTGKGNYAEFSRFIGEDCVAEPDLVATKYPIESAAFFFNSNKVWSTCDRGSDDRTVEKVTLIVNNGTLGLNERTIFFRKFFNVLN